MNVEYKQIMEGPLSLGLTWCEGLRLSIEAPATRRFLDASGPNHLFVLTCSVVTFAHFISSIASGYLSLCLLSTSNGIWSLSFPYYILFCHLLGPAIANHSVLALRRNGDGTYMARRCTTACVSLLQLDVPLAMGSAAMQTQCTAANPCLAWLIIYTCAQFVVCTSITPSMDRWHNFFPASAPPTAYAIIKDWPLRHLFQTLPQQNCALKLTEVTTKVFIQVKKCTCFSVTDFFFYVHA